MTIDPIAAGGMGVSVDMPGVSQMGPGASLADMTGFQGALVVAGAQPAMSVGSPDALAPAMKAMLGQIEKVNGEAKSVADIARAAQASGADMSPGEVVNLTMKCHEFMFHCQLSSSIANRTSDGIQQLFRQQS
ncbi:hypothetical protein J2Y58_000517 [Sphingomonas sp. BE138]|uniref:hypothetical protein n=1 Tax=Sphingomonas sp. BE138 TaxID=2817845 RepID=UPI00285A483B|nr:hypothetical protein [Sphingomonas sp. BE138]MDR6787179.1 hypothetical protein [Sphingomonas sp. BE138]